MARGEAESEARLDTIRASARPLHGDDGFDPLVALAADRRVVLLGEASHGTHEFYRARADITRRLITECGVTAVAVEADWPDAYRVNRWVRGDGDDPDAETALRGFRRFPQWMWRNTDVVGFVKWLREHNERVAPERRVGFYGLDLYSLHDSIAAVLEYLRVVDSEAAKRAAFRYACFDHHGEDPQSYGYAAAFDLSESCERAVVRQLVELREAAADYARRDGRLPPDALFVAEQNARVVKNAEEYYRAMFRGRVVSWNLRDRHMKETLDALVDFLATQQGRMPRVAVWAHNSHLGDARATEMARAGELNLGQLVRQAHDGTALLVGFTTHAGVVSAASNWDAPVERKRVRPALPGSWERLFHDALGGDGLLAFDGPGSAGLRLALTESRLERAIGVIYAPETERTSHYFHALLPEQFDVVLHYDATHPVEPLERTPEWSAGELPETYPSAL